MRHVTPGLCYIAPFCFIVCEDCNEVHHGDCPVHGPLLPFDEAGIDTPSLAYTKMPIPAQLTVKPSSIPHAGLGIFANVTIPRGVRMGPYKGRVVSNEEMEDVEDTSYMWEVRCLWRCVCEVRCVEVFVWEERCLWRCVWEIRCLWRCVCG